MIRDLVIVCLCSCALALGVPAQGAAKGAAADLAWMTGFWVGPLGEQTLEENWIHPAGGTIAAVIRFVGSGSTSMFELIMIEEEQDSLVLRVRQWLPGYVPRNTEPWVMELAELADRRVRFVSAGPGEFNSLTYSRPSEDSFNIDVETKAGESFQINLHAR